MAAVVNARAATARCSAAGGPPRGAASSFPPSTIRTRKRTTAAAGGRGRLVAVSAVGDVAAEGNTYLIAGAVAVALVGTAFPILFSRKDTCPECDGAGFIRKAGATLRANAARKDEAQIVCPNCNGLGKLGQIDK
ncbi:uncharacterized protein LOC100277183 [Zea mays]|uniref:AT5g02160-like protein n=1 Tax=Zea mays TaxID=4577 RepID=B6TQK0_MAIZE|nr:uncharacterized protein LOC100277183 [Zea mays]ACG39383.1 hypothetical protein [Zea mays]AQK95535.1 AT5g02160-like protein [Zea mays]|eukprot:NP_001144296.1 uncharacterized protein LOC100277183 [Zea mays]